MKVSGKHVVVTGGSRGIGEALAREFASRGARVTVVARSEESLRKVAAEIGGHAVVADLSDDSVVDGLIDRIEADHGAIDVLVNNAGLDTSTPFAVEDPREIRAVTRLNLETTLLLTRHVLPGMLERGAGHVVLVSSLAGTAGFPGMSTYCATKAGVLNFAASLERELRATDVDLTVLAPGPVDTRMWDSVEDSPPTVQQFVRRFQRLQLIPKADPVSIARRTVDAVEKRRSFVRHPRRLSLNFWLNMAPTRISNAAGIGLKFDPLDRGRRHN
jgi:short-subunit dehydrogenase